MMGQTEMVERVESLELGFGVASVVLRLCEADAAFFGEVRLDGLKRARDLLDSEIVRAERAAEKPGVSESSRGEEGSAGARAGGGPARTQCSPHRGGRGAKAGKGRRSLPARRKVCAGCGAEKGVRGFVQGHERCRVCEKEGKVRSCGAAEGGPAALATAKGTKDAEKGQKGGIRKGIVYGKQKVKVGASTGDGAGSGQSTGGGAGSGQSTGGGAGSGQSTRAPRLGQSLRRVPTPLDEPLEDDGMVDPGAGRRFCDKCEKWRPLAEFGDGGRTCGTCAAKLRLAATLKKAS